MVINIHSDRPLHTPHREQEALTLVEVCVSIFILGLLFTGIVTYYLQGERQAYWAGNYLAAQNVGQQKLEQAWSATWDQVSGTNGTLCLGLSNWTWNATSSNGAGWCPTPMNLPVSGANYVYATNYVSIRLYNPFGAAIAVPMEEIIVDTVWNFTGFGSTTLFTNRNVSILAPDRQ